MTKPSIPVPGSREDRAMGALIGLAAGDRNGGPIEMAVRLAECLAEEGRFDPATVFDRYLDWYRNGAFDTGPVALEVFRLCDNGIPNTEAVRQVDEESDGMTAGCNPAHRIAPLAMAGFVSDDELADRARREAALTHAHPLAADASAAMAMILHRLISGDPLDSALQAAAFGRLPETCDALKDPAPVSRGGFAPETLRTALHFVMVGDGLEDTLHASLEYAGPANYCPVLVGALAGAEWGASSIPEADLDHCADLQRVAAVSERLARACDDE